jgi:hypothetical protein
MKRLWLAGSSSVALGALMFSVVAGQQRGQGGRGEPPPLAARAAAPIDLTGYWVSVVTEDWRWRMATPQKGDYQSLPLNAAARKVADAWDLAKDEASGDQCKPFGVGNIIRQPGRLHITWDDENTLKIDFDAGTQTRLLHVGASLPSAGSVPAGPKTWQGFSTATWERPARNAAADPRVAEARDPGATVPGGGGAGLRGAPPRSLTMFEGGSLNVVTTNFRDGYLRTNGVPYSEHASLTEHFDRLPPHPNGDIWLVVSSILEDPQYLNGPLYLSTHFKKEPDGSKWNPTPCKTDPPGKVRGK